MTPSSMLKGATVAIESKDEDLNKCRDLVASDDGCDLA